MSKSISLSRKAAAMSRINGTAAAMSAGIVATVLTAAGILVDSDPLAYISAIAALAAFHTLDKKGGAK